MSVKKRAVILLCITAITLITLDVRGGSNGPLGSVRSGVREVFSPLQKGVSAIANPVGDFFDGVINSSDIKSENKKLKQQVNDIKTKNKTFEAAVSENERLRDLLDLVDKIDVDNTTARVITGAPSNFETTIQVDRGSNSNVKVGDPVVDGDGLVGRVIEVSKSRATVLLITDETSGVGVRNVRTEVVGIGQGQSGRPELSMEFVDPDAKIKKGDTVVTSGLQDGRFPANIPVGIVKSVKKNASGLTKDVVLTPIVNIDEISVVSILHTDR